MNIKCTNISKTYGTKTVLNDISLEIKKGKILALLGPNGAGKSTLIKILTGQIKPSKGKIFINQKEYSEIPSGFKSDLGIMPQEIIIWDDLNIKENLEYAASMYKLDSKTTKLRVQKLIEDLKLQPEIKTLAKNLSGGYKRRLNLAISIIHDPKIIFLDEPTPGIDAQSRNLLTEYIQTLAETGNYSIVLTDHYLEEAEKLADYVNIIDTGKMITEGTVPQLKAKHGEGNLMQIHIDPTETRDLETIVNLFKGDFDEIKTVKETINVLVDDLTKNLQKALEIVKNNNIKILNINIKEPSLEDIFLLLTGKTVRE